MSKALTRRAVLGSITAAPTALVCLPGVAAPGDDSGILAAFDVRQKALALIEARGDFYYGETHSPAEVEIFDQAEVRIVATMATTPEGVLAKLWVALSYANDSYCEQATKDSIRRCDAAALERIERDLEWSAKTIWTAIRSLIEMTGGLRHGA